MGNKNNSGRVTTREFYEALLDQNKQREQMELRIIGKIDEVIAIHNDFQVRTEARLAAGNTKFENIEADIDKLDDSVEDLKLWDRRLGIIAVIGSAIATAIGWNRQ